MMDNRGQLTVALPTHQPMPLITKLLFYGVLPIALPIVVSYKMLTDKSYRMTTTSLFSLVNCATKKSCAEEWYWQDVGLLNKLWSLPSAAAYIQKSADGSNNETDTPLLEYQVREGYCGSATQRCILKSLGYPSNSIPDQKGGESKPDLWCEHVKQIAKESSHDDDGMEIETTIVRGGDVTYEAFLSTLRQGLDNPNCRICCNYLRSALTGFELTGLWKFHPLFFLIKLYGGHFSPVLGMVEQDSEEEKDNPFIAIFDTNHKYNGAYFVTCKRLYEAVSSIDVGSKKSRAIILVEKKSA
eukprot:scaffold1172_cov144-Skeletonema_menzelii.AAC.5